MAQRKFDKTRERFEALTRPVPQAQIPPAIARALEAREREPQKAPTEKENA